MTPRATLRNAGFGLIELMVALVLGLLIAVGVSKVLLVMSGVSRLNGDLAMMHENGRFAMARMSRDIQRMGTPYCSGTVRAAAAPSGDPVVETRVPLLFDSNVVLPDTDGAPISPPPGWPSLPIPMSTRTYVQGYDCGESGCSPEPPVGPSGIPAAAVAAGGRVPGTDVLTVRFLDGMGWRVASCTDSPPGVLIAPAAGEAAPDFESGELALVSDCSSPTVVRVGVSGNALSALNPASLPGGAFACSAIGSDKDTRAFNFSKGFTTVTYYVGLRPDPKNAGQLQPVLIRRLNGVDQELISGVYRLDFLYVVEDIDAAGTLATRYMTAGEVESLSATSQCARAPYRFNAVGTTESGCLWRSVVGIEAHLLVSSIDDYGYSAADMGYRYSVDGETVIEPGGADSPMPVTGLRTGKLLRREFVTFSDVRNHTL